ncbi:MAG: hypothetical protein BWY83_00892 [bacterium ADurb.Bin478]|nr:MAG: hypothetical protein BWY83_00892 [bacterium ADurb.Bin478]
MTGLMLFDPLKGLIKILGFLLRNAYTSTAMEFALNARKLMTPTFFHKCDKSGSFFIFRM